LWVLKLINFQDLNLPFRSFKKMNLVIKTKTLTLKSIVYLAGLIGTTAILAAPASAQNAYAGGFMSVVKLDGTSVNISGEISLPPGYYFQGPLTISPVTASGGKLGVDNNTISNLIVDPDTVVPIASQSSTNSLLNGGANPLNVVPTANNIPADAKIIRSETGGNGLGGLD
jgi:hypothetical protein